MGSRKSPSNYRPISLTSVTCKVFKSLLHDAIMDYLLANRLLSKEQHGFMPGRSCVTQLLTAMEGWTTVLQDGIPIDVVYLDFTKAFDSVPHKRLLVKLQAHGITGKLLNWIKIFLSGRRQLVVINSFQSHESSVISGVPQGSVLGPLLFLIYVNDLPRVISSPSLLFADDTKLFRLITDHDSFQQFQNDILTLERWSKLWQLNFNTKKSFIMHLGRNNPCYTYYIDNDPLQSVEEHKDLGVIMDSNLKFHTHTSAVASKANQVFGLIRKSFTNLNGHILPLLYKSLVRPHLEYATVVWGPTFITDLNILESVQRRATRYVQDISNLPYHDRLLHLNLPTLSYRRYRVDMIMTYNILHNNINLDPNEFYQLRSSSITRGHDYKLFKPHAQRLVRSNNFSVRVIDHWNNLPPNIVNAPSVNLFKKT